MLSEALQRNAEHGQAFEHLGSSLQAIRLKNQRLKA